MRTTIGALGSISILFVGIFALAEAAGQSESVAMNGSNSTQSAWNMSHDVFSGMGQAAGPGVVWMGVAAVVLVSLGVLVVAGTGGR